MEHEHTDAPIDAPNCAGALALVANAVRVAIQTDDSDVTLATALAQLGAANVDAKHNEANSNVFARIIAAKYTTLASKGILEGLETKVHRRTVQSVLALGKHADKESAKRAQSAISMASKRLRESEAGKAYAWPPKDEKASKESALQTMKDWIAQADESHAQALVSWVPIALQDARRTDDEHQCVLAARAALPDDIRKLLGL